MPRWSAPIHRKSLSPLPDSRRERRRLEIRERLYRAALRLFAERGFLETTVEDITEAADVGKGTFFNYFPAKEHVLAAYGGERIAAIQNALERVRPKDARVLPILRELATGVAGQSNESPALLRAIFAAHASSEAVRTELQKRLRKARQIMAEIVALAQKRGEIRCDIPAIQLARTLQFIFMGVALGWSINPEGSLSTTSGEVWELLMLNLREPNTNKPIKNGHA